MEQKFCPYPGLRPFNEEESIFFKGRDTQVSKVVSLLEKNKFLMITGASGDGKSSLTYAGLIPNARAGFFKAKFNNWRIADFRPERTPLENLVYSLTKALQIPKQEIEQAVKSGFSSLVNLYKNSKWHVDYLSDEWLLADENAKKAIKRKGANVLILVDQFEEFFTNQENFTNGIPSVESQLVMNVLLETAKIAHSQDLPIYIVCTMRSDYIGQCAAFRGLPEMIGFSQFFVPRLKRKEIQQVITEPAKLAGCQITTRLSETLINELGSGFDQLPVLQHALNQLWQLSYGANGNGKEMDLLSLAKLGGISTQTLNEEEKKEFEHWESKISTYKKKYLENPSLENVLNAHADELYENAADYYNASKANKISDDTAKQVIKIAFQCLVKTDEGRTVRSRMTLTEITKIINIPSIDEDTVAGILEIFRLQGNTFLKPYKDEQEKLERNSVLDITHESLIRNWARLKEWAKEEYEDFQTYLDFNKQLQRWLANNKSSGYLLPIGPLTYFENWYNTCEPNASWLVRYDDREIEHQQKVVDAEENLQQAQHFIKKSANKLFFTRTVLKYGANNILAVAAIFVLICSCTYFYFDYRKKQNENVLIQLNLESKEFLKSELVSNKTKAEFLINNDRLRLLDNKIVEYDLLLNSLNNDSMKIDIAIEILNICSQFDPNDSSHYDKKLNYARGVLAFLYKNISEDLKLKIVDAKNGKITKLKFDNLNWLLSYLQLFKYNGYYTIEIEKLTKDLIGQTKDLFLAQLKLEHYNETGLENYEIIYTFLYLIALDENPDYREIIKLLSPYENTSEPKKIISSIIKEKGEIFINCNKIPKGGCFELLSILYATEYEKNPLAPKFLFNLLDSSVTYNNGYYATTNVSNTILKYCKDPIDIVEKINSKSKFVFYGKLKYWDSKCKSFFENLNFDYKYRYPNFSKIGNFIPLRVKELCWKRYLEVIEENIEKENSKKFLLSKYYKLKGFYEFCFNKSKSKAESCFEKSLTIFENIPVQFRTQEYVERESSRGSDASDCYKLLSFLAVDSFEISLTGCALQSYDYYNFIHLKNQSFFLNYIIQSKRIGLYNSVYGLKVLNDCIKYTPKWATFEALNLIKFYSEKIKNSRDIDAINSLKLIEIIQLQENNKYKEAIRKLNDIHQNDNIEEFYITKIAINFIKNGFADKAVETINKIVGVKSTFYQKRVGLLLDLDLQIKELNVEEYTIYLLIEMEKQLKKEIKLTPDFFRLLGRIGGLGIDRYAINKFKNIPEIIKPKALSSFVTGIAEKGTYYKAKKSIPDLISDSKLLSLYNTILKVEIIRKSNKTFSSKNNGSWNDWEFFNYQKTLLQNGNDIKFDNLD